MPLREHLRELRKRLFLAACGLVVGAVAGWLVFDPVFHALQEPLLNAAAERGATASVNFGGLATAFDMRIKISLFLGAILTSPWWLFQLWAFVTPGLTRRERGYAIGFVGAAAPLFLAGSYLAWTTMPTAVRVLTDFIPQEATNLVDAQTYLSFVMRFVLAFGVAFVLPVIMVAVNLAGLVRASTWAKGWRWAVLLAFVFAAVMTPTPDAITMVVMALPICALYFIALGICLLNDRRVNKARVAAGLPRLDGTMADEDDDAAGAATASADEPGRA
ncbi:twin-arginine translocase subunit TatC [Cellulomonas cellasea]|uniref:twin-arginine translocase subunit TatC n=1 Tax=Cellulomonas cellasea TaxID=43670 RepID=UPI0025A38B3D|nr:twin-arginine translocase subunit TatC [Cellulomonas cellasea]MDM8083878.1 twin-arginine translocase subunit TatC [Cellulomonas cellasea]